jgi:hypothetical protein
MQKESVTARLFLIGALMSGLAFASDAQTRQTSKAQTPAQTGIVSAAGPSILISRSVDD